MTLYGAKSMKKNLITKQRHLNIDGQYRLINSYISRTGSMKIVLLLKRLIHINLIFCYLTEVDQGI